MSGQATSGRPENGDYGLIRSLLANVKVLRRRLERLVPSFGRVSGPSSGDLEEARSVLDELSSLVDQAAQQLPLGIRNEISEPIRALQRSIEKTLVVVDVYLKTVDNERRWQEYEARSNRRRSHKRYGKDQRRLHKLRLKSGRRLDELLAHLDGLVSRFGPRSPE